MKAYGASEGEKGKFMTDNPHFAQALSWQEARDLVPFELLVPDFGVGPPASIAVFMRNHRMRDVPARERAVEAHWADFVFSQTSREPDEARRLAIEVSYGQEVREGRIGSCVAKVYELGPTVPDSDPDGRSPSVVTWHEGEKFYLLASTTLSGAELERRAQSQYPRRRYG